jgi:hypothetical protein
MPAGRRAIIGQMPPAQFHGQFGQLFDHRHLFRRRRFARAQLRRTSFKKDFYKAKISLKKLRSFILIDCEPNQ